MSGLDALDEREAWRAVDHSRDGVCETDENPRDHRIGAEPSDAPAEELAVDTLLVSRVRSELQDDARERYQRLARELDRAGFAIVRTR